MLFEDMAEMIGRAHGAALDAVTRALWAAVATGQISDEDAGRLSTAIEARRALGKVVGSLKTFQPPTLASKPQRPPERSVAIERRRRLATSGVMPPALCARFTTGELAVLRIVVDEFTARQVCAICIDAIAARAGVSRTLVKGALKQARRLGMLKVRERRRTGAKSLPNVVTVVDREWLAWIKRGAAQQKPTPAGIGVRNSTTTDTRGLREGRGSRLSRRIEPKSHVGHSRGQARDLEPSHGRG